MKIEFTGKEEELSASETVSEPTIPDTEMKRWLVNYVGEKKNPEEDQVTVGLIVETMAEEFPEFLLAVAEENFIRGYHQALQDVTEGEKLHKEITEEIEEKGEERSSEQEDD